MKNVVVEYHLTFPNSSGPYLDCVFIYSSYEKAVVEGEKVKLKFGYDYKVKIKE